MYFKTWLTRILINECNYIIRSRKEQVPYEDYYEDEKAAAEQEDYPDVFEAVMELDEHYRIPWYCFMWRNFPSKKSAGY